MSNYQIDPNTVIQKYRGDLESERHKNVLLELYVTELQRKVGELEGQVTEQRSKISTMAKQLGESASSDVDEPGDVTG